MLTVTHLELIQYRHTTRRKETCTSKVRACVLCVLRCFVCLRRGHISCACTSTSKCPKCHGRHHVSICPKNQESQVHPNQVPAPAPKEPTSASPSTDKRNHSLLVHPGLNPEAPAYSPITHTSLWVNSGRTILLQTACTQVANPRRPHLSKQVRIVFNSGSQHSSSASIRKKTGEAKR